MELQHDQRPHENWLPEAEDKTSTLKRKAYLNEAELAWQVAICGQPVQLKYRPVVRRVQEVTAAYYGVSVASLLKYNARLQMSVPRMVAMKVARDMSGIGVTALARTFKRNHGTIWHDLENITKRANREPDIAKAIADIEWLVSFELERPL